MKTFVEFMSKVSSSESLKDSIRKVSDLAGLEKVAKAEGFSSTKQEVAAFFSKQADAISANIAGIDGNGSLVFGRDWAYPGPDTDGKVVM